MKKFVLDLDVVGVESLNERYILIRLTRAGERLPEMMPGQFVEVRIDGEPTVFLRRPISIHYVDRARNELWLLVAMVGSGTRRLATLRGGDRLNCVLPLGKGFSLPAEGEVLLVGGGVGIAPLYYQGACLRDKGLKPVFLLGSRTKADLLRTDAFGDLGEVFTTTEDGSDGERGFVTQHSILASRRFQFIQTCGPTPMMKAVARYARQENVECEASLENMMACGLGACLCCVEKTTDGNLCVCKDGPVFNIRRLLW